MIQLVDSLSWPLLWIKLSVMVLQGTTEETQALIAWRAASGNLFTGRRNSSINGWQ